MKSKTNCENCIHCQICKLNPSENESCNFFKSESQSAEKSTKHGVWEYPSRLSLMFVCSQCGKEGCFIRKKYCPNCGIKMSV